MVHKLVMQSSKKEEDHIRLELTAKDYRSLTLLINDTQLALHLFDNLKKLCFSGSIKDYSYCMVYARKWGVNDGKMDLGEEMKQLDDKAAPHYPSVDGWGVYDVNREFKRQGVDKT